LKFEIIERTNLADGSMRILLELPQSDLIYMGFILESFEGWCIYTTPRRKEPFLQLDIPIDFISNVEELLSFLKTWDHKAITA